MKKKKIFITLAIFIVSITSNAIYSLSKGKEVIMSNHINKINDNGMLSLLVETGMGTGKYTESTSNTWPDGYSLNKTLSKCENGGTLEFDETNKKVSVSTASSDRCYVYFDYPLPNITVDATNIPTTYGKSASLSCSGATASYSDRYQSLKIKQLNTKSASCTLNYTDRTNKTYLNNKIISLSGTTQGSGSVVNEKGYRYEGENPNNYIWFNNEMWRIIGVFDVETHGVASTNLVKIIRNEPIGGLVLDKSQKNDWANSSLKSLLNTEYLNSTNGTNGNNCYGYYTFAKAKCDYRETGIKSGYRSMIKEVTWKVGGHTTDSATAATFYTAERGSATGNSNAYASEVTAKIGLMYLSDYGYAVPVANCARTTNLSSYDSANCTLNNWLYGIGYEWTITPYSSSADSVFYVYGNGRVYNSITRNGYAARPVLYLDYSVYVIDGDGTYSNPYIIGM